MYKSALMFAESQAMEAAGLDKSWPITIKCVRAVGTRSSRSLPFFPSHLLTYSIPHTPHRPIPYLNYLLIGQVPARLLHRRRAVLPVGGRQRRGAHQGERVRGGDHPPPRGPAPDGGGPGDGGAAEDGAGHRAEGRDCACACVEWLNGGFPQRKVQCNSCTTYPSICYSE